MSNTKFPLQQGALDDLCSVYAIVNFLALVCGKDFKPAQARAVFNSAIAAIDTVNPGDLQALVTEGIDPKHLVCLYNEAVKGLWSFPKTPKLKLQKGPPTPDKNTIIFFAQDQFPDNTFTHYTVVKKVENDGSLLLSDSYGLPKIVCNEGKYTLQRDHDEKARNVEILNVWYV